MSNYIAWGVLFCNTLIFTKNIIQLLTNKLNDLICLKKENL